MSPRAGLLELGTETAHCTGYHDENPITRHAQEVTITEVMLSPKVRKDGCSTSFWFKTKPSFSLEWTNVKRALRKKEIFGFCS